MKKPTIISLCLGLVLLLNSAAAGDEVSFPVLKGWKLKVSSKEYTPDNLWDLINGAA